MRRRAKSPKVRVAIGLAAAALLTLGVSAPASAAEVVMIDNAPAFGSTCGLRNAPLGQSFTATISGELTQVGIYTELAERSTRLTVYSGAGTSGAVLTSQDIVLAASATLAVKMTTLDEPVPLTAGSVYSFAVANATCQPVLTLFGQGAQYPGGSAFPSQIADDLAFRLIVEDSPGDADGDGVTDASDVCADTTLAGGPAKLKPNHYWSTAAGFVDRAGTIGFTLDETGGCSAEQIIAAAGLGTGHTKNGISVDAMNAWVASVQ